MQRPLFLVLAGSTLLTSCAGTRTSENQTTTHAEAFNLFGLQIPHDDHAKAWSMVPDDAVVITTASSPKDWDSVLGVLNSLFGFTGTQISWTPKATR